MDARELALDSLRPVGEYLADARVLRDGEAQVEVRPTVARTEGERA
jgi:hypothetical protein